MFLDLIFIYLFEYLSQTWVFIYIVTVYVDICLLTCEKIKYWS